MFTTTWITLNQNLKKPQPPTKYTNKLQNPQSCYNNLTTVSCQSNYDCLKWVDKYCSPSDKQQLTLYCDKSQNDPHGFCIINSTGRLPSKIYNEINK
jgi:hypothetical protein